LASGKAKTKSIGETTPSKRKRRYVTVEQFHSVMAAYDQKIAALWNECLDIRMGEQITNDSALIEGEQGIE
jgi:hypothetical protein